jgi:hypothetical protein
MGACASSVKPVPLGGRKITVRCAGSDGLFFGLAPEAAYVITILESANGVANVVSAHGTTFPSIEVWQYGGPGPALLYHYNAKAAGTGPSNLGRSQMRQLPFPEASFP